MMRIDGSFGEGGGQILRSALALAALLGREVCIERIRQGRPRPGLAAQHLTAAKLLAEISRARLEGASLGSQELGFHPASAPQAGRYHFDVGEARRGGSAGAVSLVLQAAILPLALAAGTSELSGKGGTHVAWSPPFHYLEGVWLPMLGRLGIEARLTLERWGWYPQGGGRVSCQVKGKGASSWKGVAWEERGKPVRFIGLSASSRLPPHIAERQARRMEALLGGEGLEIEVKMVEAPASGPGTMAFLLAEFEKVQAGFVAYGRRGKPAEAVAEEAVAEFLEYYRSGKALDPRLADQMVLPLALAEGESSFTTSRITRHLLTNLWLVRQMLGTSFCVEGEEGGPGKVQLSGRGEEKGDV